MWDRRQACCHLFWRGIVVFPAQGTPIRTEIDPLPAMAEAARMGPLVCL